MRERTYVSPIAIDFIHNAAIAATVEGLAVLPDLQCFRLTLSPISFLLSNLQDFRRVNVR